MGHRCPSSRPDCAGPVTADRSAAVVAPVLALRKSCDVAWRSWESETCWIVGAGLAGSAAEPGVSGGSVAAAGAASERCCSPWVGGAFRPIASTSSSCLCPVSVTM